MERKLANQLEFPWNVRAVSCKLSSTQLDLQRPVWWRCFWSLCWHVVVHKRNMPPSCLGSDFLKVSYYSFLSCLLSSWSFILVRLQISPLNWFECCCFFVFFVSGISGYNLLSPISKSFTAAVCKNSGKGPVISGHKRRVFNVEDKYCFLAT